MKREIKRNSAIARLALTAGLEKAAAPTKFEKLHLAHKKAVGQTYEVASLVRSLGVKN